MPIGPLMGQPFLPETLPPPPPANTEARARRVDEFEKLRREEPDPLKACLGAIHVAADRGHLNHALLLRGWTARQTVAIIAGLTVLTCGSALLSYFTNNDIFAWAVTGTVFVSLAVARVFGHADLALVASRSRSLVTALVSHGVRSARPETAVHVQGTRKWQKLWTSLREVMPSYNVTGLTLNIAIPTPHESFYATWKCKEVTPSENDWRLTLPLTINGHSIGHLSLVGASEGQQAILEIQQVIDYLESLPGQLADVADRCESFSNPMLQEPSRLLN